MFCCYHSYFLLVSIVVFKQLTTFKMATGYFKIVAVMKKKRIDYSYIPYKWEENNVLYWPQANLSTLRKDPLSEPQSDWRQFPCKVKKTNIFGLEEAELWEEQFIDDGTDAENSMLIQKPNLRTTSKPTKPLSDYDILFEVCEGVTNSTILQKPSCSTITEPNRNQTDKEVLLEESKITKTEKKRSKAITKPKTTTVDIHGNIKKRNQSPSSPTISFSTSNSPVSSHSSSTMAPAVMQVFDGAPAYKIGDLNYPLNSEQIFVEPDVAVEFINNSGNTLLETISKNQTLILQKLEKLSDKCVSEFVQQKATYDKMYGLLKKISLGESGVLEEKKPKEDKNKVFEAFLKFPLSTTEDIFTFNNEIVTNKAFKNHLIKSYTIVGGTDGNEEGRIIAKKLRTIFFTQNVLTQFSWTGMSRTSGVSKKESFQKCEGIINVFFEILSKADNRWSVTKNEKFFKYHTLKHANQLQNASEKKQSKKDKKKDGNLQDNLDVDTEIEIENVGNDIQENDIVDNDISEYDIVENDIPENYENVESESD